MKYQIKITHLKDSGYWMADLYEGDYKFICFACEKTREKALAAVKVKGKNFQEPKQEIINLDTLD